MEEIIKKYEKLYDKLVLHLADDKKREKAFRLLENITKEMLQHISQRDPQFSKKILEKLESIEWNQYLSQEEAQQIYNKFQLKPKWDYNTLENHLTKLGIECEHEGCYNKHALLTTMSNIYSKHGHSIAKMLGKMNVNELQDHEIIPHIHIMAIEKLKDKDGYYEIREYFDV